MYDDMDLPAPANHMVFAILTTIFCCLPFGIVAIVKASSVNSHYAGDNYELAVAAADSALNWCIAAMISGVMIGLLTFAMN